MKGKLMAIKETKAVPEVKKTPEPKKEKAIIYYCSKGMPTFHIPEYERDSVGDVVMIKGKPSHLVERDADGNNPRKIHKKITFDRHPILDPKTHKPDASRRVGKLIITPESGELWERRQEIVDFLENAKKHALNGIMTEDEFKKGENMLAFTFAQENEGLKTQLSDAQRRIAELEEQLTTPK
jgi:hypothetical protein